MPFYQCPRCGGTDSFGQWEQRFKNTNVSYYDNQRHPIGSSNNGFGVSSVRQQYCVNCVSVKMDFRLSSDDLHFIGNVLTGIGNLITALVNFVIRLISRSAPYFLIAISIGLLFFTLDKVNHTLPNWYIVGNVCLIFVSILIVEILRKFRIRKQDKKFLEDRFHKIVPPLNRRRYYFFTIIAQILTNTIYLFQVQN